MRARGGSTGTRAAAPILYKTIAGALVLAALFSGGSPSADGVAIYLLECERRDLMDEVERRIRSQG